MGLMDLLKKADGCRLDGEPMLTEDLVPNAKVRTYLNGYLQQDNFVVTEEFIKKLHTFMYSEKLPEAGNYREESEELNRYIQHYLGQLEVSKGMYHPIEFAAIAHKRFMDVSPFSQGNAEIAWLLLNFWLIRAGYTGIRLEEIDQNQYQSALAQARNPQCPDPDDLVGFVAQAVIEKGK